MAGDEVVAMAPTMETLRPDEVPGRRPVDHPAGPDHRHPARGAGQDRRLRRVPLRRQQDGKTGSRRRSRSPRRSSCSTPGRRAPEGARRRPGRRVRARSIRASRCDEQVPDHGAIIGYALATYPPRRDEDGRLHRPAGHEGRPGLPQGGQASPSRATTTSRSSATSRAG